MTKFWDYMPKRKLYPDLEVAIAKEIARLRKETLEINQLLSKDNLTAQNAKRLKELFLQDADDADDLTIDEWQELLKNRIVISPNEKQLVLLADKLCSA